MPCSLHLAPISESLRLPPDTYKPLSPSPCPKIKFRQPVFPETQTFAVTTRPYSLSPNIPSLHSISLNPSTLFNIFSSRRLPASTQIALSVHHVPDFTSSKLSAPKYKPLPSHPTPAMCHSRCPSLCTSSQPSTYSHTPRPLGCLS